MSQINTWDGGVNTRAFPALIGINQGVEYINVDNLTGNLKPVKEDTKLQNTTYDYFYKFKDVLIESEEQRSYVEYNRKLYFSNGEDRPMKSSDGLTFEGLGIDAPTIPPAVDTSDIEPIDIGIITPPYKILLKRLLLINPTLNGAYSYVYTYYNEATGEESSPSKVTNSHYRKRKRPTSQPINFELVLTKSEDSNVTHMRLYRAPAGTPLIDDHLYRRVGQFANVNTTFRDTVEIVGGLPRLSEAPIKPEYRRFKGVIQYCYTYYNIEDGTESPPSPFSEEEVIKNPAGLFVTVDNITATDDPQVSHIRLYRMGATLAGMFLVTELENKDQDFIDNIPDVDILGVPLDTFNNNPAPFGLDNLTEANAMLFGSIDNKLYYTDIGYPNYWSSFNFIVFDEPITGIGNTAVGLIVFTQYKTFIVVGNAPETLAKYLLSSNQGCINHKTIQFISNTLLWVSTDGLCASSGGEIQVLTKGSLGLVKFDVKDAEVFNEVYYLALADKILAYDYRIEPIIRFLDIKTKCMEYHNDKLLFIEDREELVEDELTMVKGLYELGTHNDNKTMVYKSGYIAEESLTNLKTYKVMYVQSSGDLTMTLYIDNEEVATTELVVGLNEVKVPVANRQGYHFSYKVEGTGEIYEIEFKAEGRQNGR